MKCSLGISNFPEEISSLSYSIVFLYFFVLIPEESFLISPCYSLELCIRIGISFLFSFAFCFFSFLSDLLRPPQTTILSFCISFSWGWSWSLPPVQCQELPSIVLQALCLSDLVSSIYLSLPLYSRKEFNLGHTWLFFNLNLNLAIRSSQSEPQSAPSHFCCLYRASPFLVAKNIINLISVLTIWWCPCVQ